MVLLLKYPILVIILILMIDLYNKLIFIYLYLYFLYFQPTHSVASGQEHFFIEKENINISPSNKAIIHIILKANVGEWFWVRLCVVRFTGLKSFWNIFDIIRKGKRQIPQKILTPVSIIEELVVFCDVVEEEDCMTIIIFTESKGLTKVWNKEWILLLKKNYLYSQVFFPKFLVIDVGILFN